MSIYIYTVHDYIWHANCYYLSMTMREYAVSGVELRIREMVECKGHFPGLISGDKLSHERLKCLLPAHDAATTLSGVGITAMRIFGPDIPDDVGKEIKAAIEKLRELICNYTRGPADATEIKAAVREARAKAAEIRKALRTRS